jgi:hypothetical protein
MLDLALARAKFVLAFSNRVHQAGYTHPEREYLTARWVDSLAHGAVIAGIAPQSRPPMFCFGPAQPSICPEQRVLRGFLAWKKR